jgi:hypothetical protein
MMDHSNERRERRNNRRRPRRMRIVWVSTLSAVAGIVSASGLALAAFVGACVAFAVPSPATADDDNPSNPYCFDAESCDRNINGAFGLTPKRTYRAVMSDDDAVCVEIVHELNAAIVGEIKPWQTVPGSEFDNPLYSGPTFLRWSYLAGKPGTKTRRNAAKDDSSYRWLIAPVLNDGKPMLVTKYSASVNDANRIGQPWLFWDMKATSTNDNWENPASYSSMSPLSQRIEPSELVSTLPLKPLKVQLGADPLVRTTFLYAASNPDGRDLFPKLPRSRQKGAWRFVNRRSLGNETNFATIGHFYYAILDDGLVDALVVFKLHPSRIGDDVCYIESDLSEKIWSHIEHDTHVPAKP